jgi:ABC-2 type transport system ATP-binding protein
MDPLAPVTSRQSPVIETRDLTRCFGSLVAVDRVNLAIEPGEVFALLGRNGAGKTTVIKMLCTLIPPTSGGAWVGGFDVEREPDQVRRIIGYVPQALSADGELTGYENLLVFARLYEIPRAEVRRRIAEALEFMELAPFADKLVRTYSGGMIRRLEIAQSMLHDPRVLFLDEPTVGLDPVARAAVWQLLERLQSRSRSAILLTTHYLEEAERLCGRVAIMNRGRITAIGSPRALAQALGPRASFEDAFEHYTAAGGESLAAYDATSRARAAAQRHG